MRTHPLQPYATQARSHCLESLTSRAIRSSHSDGIVILPCYSNTLDDALPALAHIFHNPAPQPEHILLGITNRRTRSLSRTSFQEVRRSSITPLPDVSLRCYKGRDEMELAAWRSACDAWEGRGAGDEGVAKVEAVNVRTMGPGDWRR